MILLLSPPLLLLLLEHLLSAPLHMADFLLLKISTGALHHGSFNWPFQGSNNRPISPIMKLVVIHLGRLALGFSAWSQLPNLWNHVAIDCLHRMDHAYQGRHPDHQRLAAMVAAHQCNDPNRD